MSEPTRWRDDASAPDGARALLGAAGGSRPIPREVRARSAARMDRIVALPAAAGVALWIKGIALAAGIGTATVVVVPHVLEAVRETRDTRATHETARHADAPAPPVIPARGAPADPAPQESPESAASPSDATLGADAPARVDAPPARAANATSPAPALLARAATPKVDASAPRIAKDTPEDTRDALTREASMLEEARAALATHPADALAKLDAHAAAFPAGQLTMKRELLAVDALRRLDRTTEARARGEALVTRARGSIYEARARHILEMLSPIP